jgi:hypothetical protein
MKIMPKIKLKKYLEEIGFFTTGILFLIAIIGAVIYSNLPFVKINFVVALLSMLLAVFGCYYLFLSFEREEKPLELEPGEERNLRTLEVGVVIFPKKLGSVRSKEMHKGLDIYLTTKRILARDSSGESFLDLPLDLIYGIKREKVIATEYIRIRFFEKGKQKDVLIFVGDEKGMKLWISRLKELGIKEISEKKREEEEEEGEFLENVGKIKEEI